MRLSKMWKSLKTYSDRERAVVERSAISNNPSAGVAVEEVTDTDPKITSQKESWLGYPYFTTQELSCKCGCTGLPRPEFVAKLVTVRSEAGFPFIIASGYRCPDYNAKVSGSGRTGPHTKGEAVDIAIYGERALKLIQLSLKHGFSGIGVHQKGLHRNRFIHIDTSSGPYRPNIWSY